MKIRIKTEQGIQFEMKYVIRIVSVHPEYVIVHEQLPGCPKSNHTIHLDNFTGRLTGIEILEV